MDGPFWHDTRLPFVVSDAPSVTLTGTLQAMVPTSFLPVLGPNYFNYVGKALRIKMFGRYTTVATPGAFNLSYLWGSNANNTGTSIASSALTMTANQTTLSWQAELIVRARSLGATGSVFAYGVWHVQTAGFILVPFTTPAAVTIDLTANNFISPQMSRSGSTAETVQVHDIVFESLN